MKIKIPLRIVELEEDNFHLIISSLFFDSTIGYWVIDTGASKTVFDKNLKSKYKLSGQLPERVNTAGIGGMPMESELAEIKEISLGKLKLENFKVALLDLSPINELYAKAANLNICGLLGGDFLMKHNAVVDYKRKIITLNSERSN